MEYFCASKGAKIPDSGQLRSFSKLEHFEYVETGLIACNKAAVLQVKAEPTFQDYLMCITKKCSSCWRKYKLVLLNKLE